MKSCPASRALIDRRDDRAVVAEDAGEEGAAVRRRRAPQVVADLLLDGARPVAGLAELAEGLDLGRGPGKRSSVVQLLEPALGVDRRAAAGAGGGDRLAVDRVHGVAGGEDAVRRWSWWSAPAPGCSRRRSSPACP